ncbi:hypothetical protein OTU49_006428 [Cherax quadricarinatus]|uniref:Lipoprotein n=1 Tax=Cherax quadricarinatus TaxID=27406 RepID=A0AAW0X6K9_CHEQU
MVDADTGAEVVFVSHANFFASPRISQDGQHLIWLQWNYPRMPWDDNKMFVGEIKNKKGNIAITKFFQHGSMMMPSFDQNNELFYVHDSTGWWNLYRVTRRGFEVNLTPESQEVGWPMWKLGRKAYAVNPRVGSNEAVVICGNDLTVVDLLKEKRRIIKTGYTSYSQGVAYSLDGSKVYVVAGDGVRYPGLVEVVVETGETREVSPVSQVQVDAGYLSTARLIQFPTSQGDFAYGYLYMPKVVPPSQAREMYEMVRNKSIPTALLLFQGEGHGFTRPDTCMKALEAEYCFFAQVFNLTPADLTCDVMIDNLDTWRAES